MASVMELKIVLPHDRAQSYEPESDNKDGKEPFSQSFPDG